MITRTQSIVNDKTNNIKFCTDSYIYDTAVVIFILTRLARII